MNREIPYYRDFVSDELLAYLQQEARAVKGVSDLVEVGHGGGLETSESLRFLCELYDLLKDQLNTVLKQRVTDRQFFDQRTKACFELNKNLKIDFLDSRYKTVIGEEDAKGRIVVGPKNDFFCRAGRGAPISEVPKFLRGSHVTLFGPPDDAKLSINAMNSLHRKIKDEPEVISELVDKINEVPKWGADDEDSKTPLREDLVAAGEHLTGCFDNTLSFTDPKTQKKYDLAEDHLAVPIKRFPGLALPCVFLLYRGNPLPLHLYDFAIHFFKNWHNTDALAFYVPKLETEEEAAYIRTMMATAEKLIQKHHPEYKAGSIRLFIVLENPRAIFRVNEIMDELHPYFAGASLGWHDYLSSTARLFKEDANYRIPVKADPDIVIKYIKASHNLLADVVGSRGGIKIGGMYGVLPMDNDLKSPSFQITIRGFIKDVITQMKRDLSGFWVAHPDFVRIGMALVQAWKVYQSGDKSKLESLVKALLDEKYHAEILKFIYGPDIQGLDINDPLYPRSLLVADIKESNFIANNHPDEIRYNVFQSLQYLTDWLSGNGCVALPAQIDGVAVRVMDDLATAERSRWEVWHEIYHGRFSVEEFLKIVHEEMVFIRKDLSDSKKIVQVKWSERTSKWYPIAEKIMIQLMTQKKPVEFATELLMPFTIESIRNSDDPWAALKKADATKHVLDPYVERFHHYFGVCGNMTFAAQMAKNVTPDLELAERLIKKFSKDDVIFAARFHGDIGESKKTLDKVASREQALVSESDQVVASQLKEAGAKYLKKFGMKFLISAQGKSGEEMLLALQARLENKPDVELDNARQALWEISLKRLKNDTDIKKKLLELLSRHKVVGAQIAVSTGPDSVCTINLGKSSKSGAYVTDSTLFELASLSKTLASFFAIQYFQTKGISLNTNVNSLLERAKSDFRLRAKNYEWTDQVTLAHLINHSACNMHYVNGVPATEKMPKVSEFLSGNKEYGYSPIEVLNPPGSVFQYSGGGFLVLEHLIESLEKKSAQELSQPFFAELGLKNLTFEQKTLPGLQYANGYLDDDQEVNGTRKMFPAFAAGAMGTAHDMTVFLQHLTRAFNECDSAHDAAVLMLHGQDKGSRRFMAADAGLGIFIAEAGPNRLALHQGANDGFRCLYVHCFSGPDRGKGFTILCNADTRGVFFVAEAAQLLLKHLNILGVNTELYSTDCDLSKFSKEEQVNQGYKSLVFKAFAPDLPEAIEVKGPLDALASDNLAVGASILEVTNQRFARAENLISPYLPVFDPALYGNQGKIMDSWETVRHNENPPDFLILQLKTPSQIQFVSLSTKYHLGNQAEAVRIEGRSEESLPWRQIVSKTNLNGHAIKFCDSEDTKTVFKQIKVSMFPDGGLTRLGLFNKPLDVMTDHIFSDPIPHSARPLAPKYAATQEEIQRNLKLFSTENEVDVASSAFGGRVVSASNEHYGPATQIISPYPPLNMFDGFESARSRKKSHFEEIVIELGKPSKLHRIVVDFKYFKNNNPRELAIQGLTDSGGWVSVVDKTYVKPYAGNFIEFFLKNSQLLRQLKITVYPDGGLNRIHAFGKI